MTNPESIIAQSSRRSPMARISAPETTAEPPDSASSLPMTVPSPMTIATNPSVSPTPDWNARVNLGERHAGREADRQRAGRQGEEGGQAHDDDQHDDEGDA